MYMVLNSICHRSVFTRVSKKLNTTSDFLKSYVHVSLNSLNLVKLNTAQLIFCDSMLSIKSSFFYHENTASIVVE